MSKKKDELLPEEPASMQKQTAYAMGASPNRPTAPAMTVPSQVPAAAAQNQTAAQVPGGAAQYQSPYNDMIRETVGQILNRKKFDFNVDGDALWKNYQSSYQRNALLGMKNQMGISAGLTGGYGNSWAATAGQQVYDQTMQGLNDKVPELYSLARSMYDAEGSDLKDRLGLLQDADAREYSRFADQRDYDYRAGRDAVADARYDKEFEYQQGRDRIADERYDKEFEYQQGRDAVADARYEKEFLYQQGRDKVADERYDKEFEYQQGRDKIADDRYDSEFEYQKKRDKVADEQFAATNALNLLKASASGSKTGTGASGAGLDNVASMSSKQIVDALNGYKLDGDNDGLAAFLDDCVATGRMTEQQADSYYMSYRTDDGSDVIDTTVGLDPQLLDLGAQRLPGNLQKKFIWG